MRITFLAPHVNISGGVRLILGYAHRLNKKGHKVTVVSPQHPSLKRFLMNFFGYKPDWTEVSGKIKYVPSFEEIFIPDGDVVVATAWQTAPFVASYSPRKGRKLYLFMHYERLDVDNFTYKLPLFKIVISSCLQKTLKEKFGEDSVLIRAAIDHKVFYPIREGYNLNKRICMLYHPAKWKGVADGLKAFEIVRERCPEIRLVMFGAREKKNNIECEYYFKPSDKKLREIYNSCDIFLCPSWKEGFGLPSAEAMACKCALVTTDNGGCRDYAIHEKTALVSSPKNPELLAENLMKLLGDESLLKKIAQNGYEHIKQFTWDEAIRKIEKIFES